LRWRGAAWILAAPGAARAQSPGGGPSGRLLRVGGYFFTGVSARSALGTPQFYDAIRFYVRPARFGAATVTGGAEILSATGRSLPYGPHARSGGRGRSESTCQTTSQRSMVRTG